MHPYSGGSKLASVVPNISDPQKGVQKKGQRQRVSQRRNSELTIKDCDALESTDLRSQKKTGPPRLGVQCRAGLRLVEAVVTQEHGSQGRGGEGEGGSPAEGTELKERRGGGERDGSDRHFLVFSFRSTSKENAATAACLSPLPASA